MISGRIKVKIINSILEIWFSNNSTNVLGFKVNAIEKLIRRQGYNNGLEFETFVICFKISNVKVKLIANVQISPKMQINIKAESSLWKNVPNSIYLTEVYKGGNSEWFVTLFNKSIISEIQKSK